MKFLLVTGILPPDIGGPARVISELATDLRVRGHQVVTIAYAAQDSISADGSDIRVSRQGSTTKRYLAMQKAIRKQLADPSVTVLATDVFSVGIPTRLALIGKSNQFILRLGGEWAWEDAVTKGRFYGTLRQYWKTSHGLRGLFEKANYRWILGRANQVCVTSKFLGEVLLGILGRGAKITVTPNEVISSAPHDTKSEKGSGKIARLLYIGRFAPVKNVPFLTKVLVELAQEGLSFEADIVGEGPDRRKIEELLRGQSRIRLLPPQQKEALFQSYQSHDLLLLPSLSDICPNGVLEALSVGLPCLMTSEHGLTRPIGGTIELDPLNAEDWKSALRVFISHPEKIQTLKSEISLPKRSSDERSLIDILTASERAK